MRISTWVLVLLMPITSFATFNKAQFGGGLMVGTFAAVTGKYWLSKTGALDFGLALWGYPGSAIFADYLFHIPNIFGRGSKFTRETEGYLGGGGGIALWGDSYECGRWGCDRRSYRGGTGIFLRGFAGFEWFPAPTRFGVFAEAGPTFLLTPAGGGSLEVAGGGRYYF